MAKINLNFKGSPVKVEGETDPKKTENVLKHAISSLKEMSTSKSDTIKESIKTVSGDVKQMFIKGTDAIIDTSDTRHQHKVEKKELAMKRDQQEHEQKMEIKEFNEKKKGLFDKWSEHQLQKKELEIEAKRQEKKDKEEAERKKRILNIIEIVAAIAALLLLGFLFQKLFK